MSRIASVGVDLQSIDQVEEALALDAARYIGLSVSEEEARDATRHHRGAAAYLAGRFAAREAVLKVLEVDDAWRHWPHVTLSPAHSDAPEVVVTDDCAKRVEARGLTKFLVSISRTERVAVALCVADTTREGEE